MADLGARLKEALGSAYRIERELPGGGMSRVFLATEVRLSRQVVVKVLPPDMANAMQAERFTREIEVAASLQHPHIVPLLTAGSEGDLAWYIMPFVTGETLAAKVARQGALPVMDAVRILRDVVDALAYSHANGIVHRDIKPANVMFSGKHALVTDFGVAKALSALSGGEGGGLTSIGITIGTPTYMAPEQAAADPHVDHRADLYAVGVMAYEMLTGRTPFMATTPQAMLAAHVTAFPDPITQHRDSLPPALAAAVMKCLAKMPGDRWQSAEELGAVLESWGTPSGGMTPVATAAFVGHRESAEEALRKARFWRVAGIFAVSAVAVVSVVFAATRVFGLPDWVWVGAAGLMALGAPIIWYTGRVERRRARAVIAGRTSAENPAHYHFFTWRRAITGGGVALALLLLATVGYAGARALGIGPAGTLLSSGTVGAGDRFVLADFVNRTPDSTIGTSITEAIRVDLSQSRVLRMVSVRDVSAALTRMTLDGGTSLTDSLALVMAQREGVKAVIAGEISTLGTGYVLTANVLEATTGEAKVSVRATAADASHLLGALNDLSTQLRERIGESLRDIRASEPLEQVTTKSLQALRHYTAGQRAALAGDWAKARDEARAAIALDPEFATAYRMLYASLNNSNAPVSEAVTALRKAFANRDRLPPVERSRTESMYYINVAPDWERAVTSAQSALAQDSLNVGALGDLSFLYMYMDRYAEAEDVARRYLAIRTSQAAEQALFTALVGQEKWAAADSLAVEGGKRWTDGAMALAGFRGAIANARHDLRAWDSVLRSLPADIPNTSVYSMNLAFQRPELAYTEGRFEDADREAERLSRDYAEDIGAGNMLRNYLTRPYTSVVARGDTALARRQLAELLRRYPLESMAAEDRPYESLRDLYGKLRDVDGLRRLRASFEGAIPAEERSPGMDLGWDLAEAEARGDDRAALDLARRWRAAAYCQTCRLTDEATWWERTGHPDSALTALERVVNSGTDAFQDNYYGFNYGPSLYRAGGLAEELGDRAKARGYYQRFVEAWRNAEPAFQPQVAEAKRRLAALGSDTPRP
jgi:tetratricopeptide (TPR) repeat protein